MQSVRQVSGPADPEWSDDDWLLVDGDEATRPHVRLSQLDILVHSARDQRVRSRPGRRFAAAGVGGPENFLFALKRTFSPSP